MKKVFLMLAASAAMLMACNEQPKPVVDDTSEIDSLQSIIDEKDSEIKNMASTISEIQEGFKLINEAEGRVNTLSSGNEGASNAQDIKENIQFIQETLAQNKRKIQELQRRIDAGSNSAKEFKTIIESLTEQLNTKTAELAELREQLAQKDVKIAELDKAVADLKEENDEVKEQKAKTEEIAQNQDAQLNTAWYVYGTSSELKEHRILVKGDVLQGNYDKSYFTKIDIRKTTVIPFNSKSANMLTTHPAGSYTLLKDSKGQYTLRITDPNKFWSISKYLVVKVK